MNGNTLLKILTCLICGYLLGSISPSFFIGKIKGYDPRQEGSGNLGASNTVIMAGKLAGLLVALLDILKSAAAWWICRALFPEMALAGVLGGVAALMGHLFPIWLHFHGGKGLACLGGICLAHDPKMLLLMLGVAILIGIVTNYVCIVTVSMSVIVPLYYGLTTAFWLGAAVMAIPILPIFCKHMVNFRRIKTGEELRLSFLFFKDKELKRIGREE
jgi:glycerol-3-phosphate acyltransferase PlsY